MGLEIEKKRISNYINSEKSWPIIVDLQNREELSELKDFFNVGDNSFVSASTFCDSDGILKIEELYKAIADNDGITFITGLTGFLKLLGAEELKHVLKDIVLQGIKGHVVVVTYQCKNYLKFSDPRIVESGRVIISGGEPDISPDLCLIAPDLFDVFPDSLSGIDKFAEAFEKTSSTVIYVASELKKSIFTESIFSVHQLVSGYDILCEKDSRTKLVPSDFGTPDQWNYALHEMGEDGDWDSIVVECFTPAAQLSQGILAYANYAVKKKWLYFIVLSILGVNDNAYLQLAVHNASDYSELIKSVFRTILTVDKDATDFDLLYEQRKYIIKNLVELTSEAIDFCKVVAVKEKDYIYYLTDVTQPEREKVIAWLDMYGEQYTIQQLRTIFAKIYPEIAEYLSNYRFKNDLLDTYFERYKYQKAINKILPSFETVVDEQSRALDFVSVLQPRSLVVDKIDVKNSHAYFVDAMGVEYLGFIQSRCNQYGLSANITCARSELPTLTCFNKDFVEVLKSKGCMVSDIKDLDEIKHHGEDNFDYEKVKIPVYLISELSIIDELLKKIQAAIAAGTYEKAVVISDHGASRLAVLHNTENIWQMSTSGIHSGRCCSQNEIDTKPDYAIESEGYWVLANYDRFRGGRKGNCEVHGGATLEEVAIPIIEITRKPSSIEAFILDASKIVTIGAQEIPSIKLYVGLKSNNVEIKVLDNYYDATPTAEEYIYEVTLPEFTKKGIYSFDIYVGSDLIAKGQTFEIKKKGMSENNLFG